MDFIIKKLNKEYLQTNISAFIDILKDEPYEYWNEDNFLFYLPEKFELSYTLELDGVIAAYIISSLKDGKIAYIHKFMTKKDYRSLGLGKLILSVYEMNCFRNGLAQIQLSVVKLNYKAINFYKKNGFSIISERHDINNNIELTIMNKNLKA
jgi:ribosomal protein S18 acetylase RimI-like enzyme